MRWIVRYDEIDCKVRCDETDCEIRFVMSRIVRCNLCNFWFFIEIYFPIPDFQMYLDVRMIDIRLVQDFSITLLYQEGGGWTD